MSAITAFKSMRLGRTSINCQVGRSLAAHCFWVALTLLRA